MKNNNIKEWLNKRKKCKEHVVFIKLDLEKQTYLALQWIQIMILINKAARRQGHKVSVQKRTPKQFLSIKQKLI